MIIESKAPTRIDLAGGTVDIWPIYLFLDRPATLNLGISLYAEAKLEEAGDVPAGAIVFGSQDQKSELAFDIATIDHACAPPQLELHLKLFRHFLREKAAREGGLPKQGLKLTTRAQSPAGAGLGGSSTLSIAMIGALATWARGSVDPLKDGERLIEIARDTETTVIQVPAGLQDYYGAMFGGLQSLRWRAGTHERMWLSQGLLPELEKRLVLFYSGQSRNSGINNWALFKSFIDRQENVRERFAAIAQATSQLETALEKRDWAAAGRAIDAEWSVRRTLAPGISTPEMNQAFDLAREGGAAAGKICGAGGGGCFFVYLPSGEARIKDQLVEKITKLGVRHLPFEASPQGLTVTRS